MEFNESDYKYYVNTGPRPYDIFILFVSEKIPYCEQVKPSFEGAAMHYKNAKTYHATRQYDKIFRPVFFAIINHDHSTAEIFKSLDFRTVPNIL